MKKAFTIIELLVVVAIITILAGLLMPALDRARRQARGVSCMSNERNVGMQLHMISNEQDGYFPTCYEYINGWSSKPLDGSPPPEPLDPKAGYYHWTAIIDPEGYPPESDPWTFEYPMKADVFVCPSHQVGGFAPTNFTVDRIPEPPPGQITQTDGVDDMQCPRLSYVPNEVILPRKKFSASKDEAMIDAGDPEHTRFLSRVKSGQVRYPEQTIMVAEFSQSANCILGSSGGGGWAYKSHRPTNAIKVEPYMHPDLGLTEVFDGELYELQAGLNIYQLTATEARTAIEAVLADPTVAAENHHISYIDPEPHPSGANYLFVDGHVGRHTLEDTLDPDFYMWGDKVYSCFDQPIIQADTS
jgi:prepilin-type processing-associated H-X9-DG protein/prepilin-type N-terminal cleavage/methylation domain-containing protein